MDIFLLILSIICGLTGIVGCIIPALPGPPLAYLAMLLLHWSGLVQFSFMDLTVWGLIIVAVSVVDFLLTPWMTKRFGGSKAGTWGSIIGLFAGMFMPWPIGPFAGPFLGAFIGEIIVSQKDSSIALRAAIGSFLSFFVGTGIKLLTCVGMLIFVICSR